MGRTFPRKRPLVWPIFHGSPDQVAEAMDRLVDERFSRVRRPLQIELRGPRAKQVPRVPPEAIPIRIARIRSASTVFPATPRDLREIMRRLPPWSINGLESIRLAIRQGKSWVVPAHQLGPGCWQPNIAGDYSPRSRIIRLYAFGHAGGPIPAPTRRRLKIEMLSTFVHEIAHHVDFMFRSGRSLRTDLRVSEAKLEAYARRMQGEWRSRIVVPYVRQLAHGSLTFVSTTESAGEDT